MKFDNQGYTFIEIIIAGFLSTGIIVGVSVMVYYFTNSFSFNLDTTRSINVASKSIRQAAEEIREARDGVNGAYPLDTVDDQELVFYSDVDSDGETEKIRYYVVGDELIRQVFEYDSTNGYSCDGGCQMCHEGSTQTISEEQWPAFSEQGAYVGPCGGGGVNEIATESTLAEPLANPTEAIFTYYNGLWPGDTGNNPIAQADRQLETRYIGVSIGVDVTEGEVGSDAVEIDTAVQLRNLKDNL